MKTEVKVDNCAENRTKLAQDMVDSWDDKDLWNFAYDQVCENLENCDVEEFNSEWNNYYGEDA